MSGRLDDCFKDEDEWMPINTAPTQQRILLYQPETYPGRPGGHGLQARIIVDYAFSMQRVASHWMPLPKPPKESSK